MKTLKVLGGLIVSIALLFVLVANFSEVESRHKCSGTIAYNGNEQPATIYLKLVTYRWWVGLWSDSNGSAWVEIPNQGVRYFERITKAGNMLQIWYTPDKLSGNFSTLSSAIVVEIGAFGVFDGTCKDIRPDA